MSKFTEGVAYAVWDLLHALSIILTLLSPIIALVVLVVLVVKRRKDGA
ncbi:hypothetical protein ACFO0N_18380 [Halobium salinum]|uniref:Uncharacterized protein n=1 Tax=Halobium salinum TaxID=1364940 RepID=A0ABD5PGR0_9EURY|nr:hypothetical protein [Halobium salinum]